MKQFQLTLENGQFIDSNGNPVEFTPVPNPKELTDKMKLSAEAKAHKSYLNQKLTYTEDGRLLDENGWAVMMDWEDPIMQHQAWTVASNRGDILNVGFGMGIVDNYIQSYAPRTHWIIECHPDVQRKMIEDGWLQKPHVRCIFAKWQDVIDYLPKFDGIYWDTWEEGPGDFFKKLPQIMKPHGIFSFFNKPRPEDVEKGLYVHGDNFKILDPIVDIHYTQFEIPNIDSNEQQGRVYWDQSQGIYYNPICTLKKEHI